VNDWLFAVIAHYRYKLRKSTPFVISTDGRNLSQVVGIYSKAAIGGSLTFQPQNFLDSR